MEGYEELWVLRDNFVATTYRTHFRKARFESFIKNSFDVIGYCNSKFNSSERNMLIRLKTTLFKAIEKRVKLLRFIVTVLDNDLIQYLAYVNKGMASMIGEWFKWLTNCFSEISQQCRELLPPKAVRKDYPQIYFVAPPRHRFFMDEEIKILMNCMEVTVKSVENVRLIKMMEIWDPNDL